MEFLIVLAVLLSFYEIARIVVLYKRIHRPIRRYVRKWHRYNKRSSSLFANPNLSLYRYAYSQLSISQLKHVKLTLDSEKSSSVLIMIVDVILKIMLPILTFFVGFVTALSSNYANLTFKQQILSMQGIIDTLGRVTLETGDTLLLPLAMILGTLSLVTLAHLLYKNIRDNAITKISGLLDQLIAEDAFEPNIFKSGKLLVEEEDFRHAAFFQIPIAVYDENKPVSRGVIRKTSYVSVTINRQSFEKTEFMFKVM